MKKVYKLLISFTLILSMLMLTACSQTFGGNYKAVTEEEKKELLTNVASAKVEDVQADGFSMTVGMEMTAKDPITQKDVVSSLKIDFKSKVKDGKLTMYGETSVVSGEKDNVEVILYYVTDTMYLYIKNNTPGVMGELKFKTVMPFDLGNLDNIPGLGGAGGVDLDLKLGDILAEYTSETCKMSVAKAGKQTKVKLEITDPEGSGEVYFVYDKDYKMVAVKTNMTGEGMKMNMELAPYSGSVKALKGLEDYVSTPLGE